jgi:secondary thiamine-phosphate synthase enzyme
VKTLSIRTHQPQEFVDVTAQVAKLVLDSGVAEGVCVVFCPHTTAGVTVNENDDTAVREDILFHLNKAVPQVDKYKHAEGNSAAHIKATLAGASAAVPFSGGKLVLGTWQGVFLCEFDGPRTRELKVSILAGV